MSTAESGIEERIELLDSGYDWDNLMKGDFKEFRLPTGNPLRERQFGAPHMYENIYSGIEETLEHDKVIFVLGTTIMGKTSALKYIQNANSSDDIPICSLYGDDLNPEDEADYAEKPIILLDEFTPTQRNIDYIRKSISEGKNIVVSVVFEYIENTKISFPEAKFVEIAPIKEDVIRKYMADYLNLKEDDDLLYLLAELSGGSALIANVFLDNIYKLARHKQPLNLRGFLKHCGDSISHVLSEWESAKGVTPYDKLIPDVDYLNRLVN